LLEFVQQLHCIPTAKNSKYYCVCKRIIRNGVPLWFTYNRANYNQRVARSFSTECGIPGSTAEFGKGVVGWIKCTPSTSAQPTIDPWFQSKREAAV
jgi:hypothetical protein